MDDKNMTNVPANILRPQNEGAESPLAEGENPVVHVADETIDFVCSQSDISAIGDPCIPKDLRPTPLVKHAEAEGEQTSSNSTTGMLLKDHELLAFKRDYYMSEGGKYNLDIQVYHLAKLADAYHKRYLDTRRWTDCLKAHSLYNACGSRRQNQDGWTEQAFKVQKSYWGDDVAVSLLHQEEITQRFVDQLQAIRDSSRDDMKVPSELASCFSTEPEEVDDDISASFIDSVKHVSNSCTENMLELASEIVLQSVELMISKPPCEFEVVAIGSMARGEATPYSDLEYIFLVEDSAPACLAYFEKLAITSYFLIGNLRETKLSYMAVEELDGWFDDCSRNGFKIDGLASGAGNIPTGNGDDHTSCKFIKTPAELLEIYKSTLDNPEAEKATKGDLTAMLHYTALLFASTEKPTLLDEFKLEIGKLNLNDERRDVNLMMLQKDMKKFDFVPDLELRKRGYTMNVKKHIFRFPSILLYDLSIIHECVGSSSWSTADKLFQAGHLSASVYSSVCFLLGCACFMRLSAYLLHNAHNDNISVARRLTTANTKFAPKPSDRWFVPEGLFYSLCCSLIPLQEQLSICGDICEMLSESHEIILQRNLLQTQFKILWSCGRLFEALQLNQDGNDSLDHLDSSHDVWHMLDSDLIDMTGYSLSHILANYGRDNNESNDGDSVTSSHNRDVEEWLNRVSCDGVDENSSTPKDMSPIWRKVDSMIKHRKFLMAKEILSTIQQHSAEIELRKGLIFLGLMQYEDAEQSITLALEEFHNKACKYQLYDYYGDPIKTNKTSQNAFKMEVKHTSVQDRVKQIWNVTTDIITCLRSLAEVYHHQNRYSDANTCYITCLRMYDQLYGEGSVTMEKVDIYCKLGRLASDDKRCEDVVGCYTTASEILDCLYGKASAEKLDCFSLVELTYRLEIAHKLIMHHIEAQDYERVQEQLSTFLAAFSIDKEMHRAFTDIGWVNLYTMLSVHSSDLYSFTDLLGLVPGENPCIDYNVDYVYELFPDMLGNDCAVPHSFSSSNHFTTESVQQLISFMDLEGSIHANVQLHHVQIQLIEMSSNYKDLLLLCTFSFVLVHVMDLGFEKTFHIADKCLRESISILVEHVYEFETRYCTDGPHPAKSRSESFNQEHQACLHIFNSVVAMLFINVGDYYKNKELYTLALQRYKEATTHLTAHEPFNVRGPQMRVAIRFRELCNRFSKLGEHKLAQQCSEESQQLFKSALEGYDYALAFLLMRLGESDCQLGLYCSSNQSFSEGLNLLKRLLDTESLIYMYHTAPLLHNMAVNSLHMDDPGKALGYLRQSLSMWEHLGCNETLYAANTLYQLGRANKLLANKSKPGISPDMSSNHQTSQQMFLKALGIFKKLDTHGNKIHQVIQHLDCKHLLAAVSGLSVGECTEEILASYLSFSLCSSGHLEDTVLAISCAQFALVMFENMPKTSTLHLNIARVRVNIGDMKFSLGDNVGASVSYRAALLILVREKHGYGNKLTDTIKKLAYLYKLEDEVIAQDQSPPDTPENDLIIHPNYLGIMRVCEELHQESLTCHDPDLHQRCITNIALLDSTVPN